MVAEKKKRSASFSVCHRALSAAVYRCTTCHCSLSPESRSKLFFFGCYLSKSFGLCGHVGTQTSFLTRNEENVTHDRIQNQAMLCYSKAIPRLFYSCSCSPTSIENVEQNCEEGSRVYLGWYFSAAPLNCSLKASSHFLTKAFPGPALMTS